jgi:hypothetical protein
MKVTRRGLFGFIGAAAAAPAVAKALPAKQLTVASPTALEAIDLAVYHATFAAHAHSVLRIKKPESAR